MKPHKRNNRFFNHDQERAHHRILNVAQVSWRVFVRSIQAKRTPFIAKNFDISPWVETPNFARIKNSAAVTWLGHATCLISMHGLSILTDPIAGSIGKFFKRELPNPAPIDQLPHIDIILISHNHRDHVDIPTLEKLKKFNPLVMVPAGDGKLLREIGFHRVIECNWHESFPIEVNQNRQKIELIFLPSVHWSGRGIFDVNRSLWGSWLIRSGDVSIYFAGDTAYGKHFGDIAHRYGPPDAVLMPVAPEEPRGLMKHSHIGVEEAIQAFHDIAAKHFFPIHWGTFAFGTDQFIEPIEKLKKLWPFQPAETKKLHLVPAGKIVFLDEI